MLVELGDVRITFWALRQIDLLRLQAKSRATARPSDPMRQFMSVRTPDELAVLAGCDRPTLSLEDVLPSPSPEEIDAICEVLDRTPVAKADLYGIEDLLSDEERRRQNLDYVEHVRKVRLNLEQYERERIAWATRVAAAEAAGFVAPGLVPVQPKLDEIDLAAIRANRPAADDAGERAALASDGSPEGRVPEATIIGQGTASQAPAGSEPPVHDIANFAPYPVGAMICYPPREPASPANACEAETAPTEATPATAGRERVERLRSSEAVSTAKGKRTSGSASPAASKKSRSASLPATSAEQASREIRWGKEPIPKQTLAPFRRWPGAP
ncbi:MAG: hypothetical protein U1E45_24890 [Geminicoccaceae bacterium]